MIGLVVLEIDGLRLTRLRPCEPSDGSYSRPVVASITALQHKLTDMLSTLRIIQLDSHRVDPLMSIVVESNIVIVTSARGIINCV